MIDRKPSHFGSYNRLGGMSATGLASIGLTGGMTGSFTGPSVPRSSRAAEPARAPDEPWRSSDGDGQQSDPNRRIRGDQPPPVAASWPQAAAISRPRVSRTVHATSAA